MLGRFDLTSPFSRRSSLGFSMGSTRLGFRFCERMFPRVCIISNTTSIISSSKPRFGSPEDDPRALPWQGSAISYGSAGPHRIEISHSDANARYPPISRGVCGPGMPPRQRARSCVTPSGNRPRVGPPRLPESSSGARRSKTVAGVPYSRTSEPIHRSSAV